MNRTIISHSQRSLTSTVRPSSQRTMHTRLRPLAYSSPIPRTAESIPQRGRAYHTSPSSQFQSSHPNTPPSPSKPRPGVQPKEEIKIEGAPFSELGATKTVKYVVIVAISIIATLETYAYGRWIYVKWFKKEDVIEEK